MWIHKIGGTSLGTAARLHTSVAAVLSSSDGPRVVVVSAPAGVTDALVEVVRGREPRGLGSVRRHCLELLEAATPPGTSRARAERELTRAFRSASRALAANAHDPVLAAGERASLAIVGAVLGEWGLEPQLVDASRVVALDSTGKPELSRIRALAGSRLGKTGLAVVPGFFGADSTGRVRVLGRGASDLSATLLGSALDADGVTIWTDTAGVWSADPRLVPSALPLPSLTWAEARRLAVAGARVLHPDTVEPVRRRGIGVVVADPRQVAGPRTHIGGTSGLASGPGRALVARTDSETITLVLADGTPEWPVAAALVDCVRGLGLAAPLGVRLGRGEVSFRLAANQAEPWPRHWLECLDVLHQTLIGDLGTHARVTEREPRTIAEALVS